MQGKLVDGKNRGIRWQSLNFMLEIGHVGLTLCNDVGAIIAVYALMRETQFDQDFVDSRRVQVNLPSLLQDALDAFPCPLVRIIVDPKNRTVI